MVGPSFSALRKRRKQKLEEAVRNLSLSEGVLGVMVVSDTWRLIESTFHHNLSFYWKRQMKIVEGLGAACVRDSDPSNELQFIMLQSTEYELLLCLANDHRVLVAFNTSSDTDPLQSAVKKVKDMKRQKVEKKMQGLTTRSIMDMCRPHTKILGGEEKVIITEKILGKEIDQRDDVNKQLN